MEKLLKKAAPDVKYRQNSLFLPSKIPTPMYTAKGLPRFLEAQNQNYLKALSEIKSEKKTTHWMWYVFPQLKGLGKSDMANFFGIESLEEAEGYLAHPILGKHLVEISEALLKIEGKSIHDIFGSPDDLKLCSCMTLFANACNASAVFQSVLEKYFGGIPDLKTLELLHPLAK